MSYRKSDNFGLCIIIEGFSGSGKSTLSKLLKKKIEKKIGKTIIFDGDNLRKFFKSINFKIGYSKKDRGKYAAYPISVLLNFYLYNNINIIYNNVGLNKSATKVWKKELKNLIYVHLKTDIKLIQKLKIKKIYSKDTKNIVGLGIKPDFPKKPDITIVNDFKTKLSLICNDLAKKIIKILN